MDISTKAVKNKFAAFCIFFAAVALLYMPLIISGHITDFDDPALLNPLKEIHSIPGYVAAVKRNQILDVQPVRDASYLIDFWLSDQIGHSTFHVSNVMLFAGAVTAAWAVLLTQNASAGVAFGFGMLLVVHPVAINSVAWIASRKHLLAAFFIMWATYWSLIFLRRERKRRYLYQASLFYFLACFSQPIVVLWPIWLIALSRALLVKVRKRDLTAAVVMLIVMTVTVIVNYNYYSGDRYLGVSLKGKFVDEAYFFKNRFMAFGRYAYQIILGDHPSVVSYFPSWPLAITGFLFCLIFCVLILKARNRFIFTWVVFGFAPLIVMHTRQTQHLGWDTYLLLPLFSAAFILYLLLNQSGWFNSIKRRYVSSLCGFLLGLFYLNTTAAMIPNWIDDLELWKYAHSAEPDNPFAIMAMSKIYLREKHPELAEPLVIELTRREPGSSELGYLNGRVLIDLDMPAKQKEALFQSRYRDSPWYNFYFGVFYAQQGNFVKAYQLVERSIFNQWPSSQSYFSDDPEETLGVYKGICFKLKRLNCESDFQKAKQILGLRRWDDKKFFTRFNAILATESR